MKAIVQDEYGSPDVLELRDIDIPRSPTGRYWFTCMRLAWVGTSGTS
jgi:hypothetical protein